ncbi:AAA family ATPase [Herbiconiux sp. KACC 21604]|uniref:AAA family ATPase n=1 Tax=unclassified Herbiconiux TaxID=2618217 RepID=UPI0020A23DAE|nr:AAA family ATPase [Herbiconiux sp. SALV-R1]WPO88015.1 AAA family ATPase [Herbiconiux sp. KACC 21604]
MRIVVSGTHASGKSTLISDFALRHPGFTVLPDPFELADEAGDAPSAALFSAQLRLSADRLTASEPSDPLIAERGPLDFLAYLLALSELNGTTLDDDALARATTMTAEALQTIDVLAVLPLTATDPIHVAADEHLDLPPP